PLNPRLPLFYASVQDRFGFTPNPDGFRYRDLGIGTFLRSGPQTFPNPNQPDWLSLAPTVDGQQQVMTARNVAMTPATMSHHRGRPGGSERADTVLPEGVFSQRLHQEPEATGALLQYARCVSVP